MAESDLAGIIQHEYVFFNGNRIARKDLPAGTVAYYFSDHLKSASVITDAVGNIHSESDYYPFGGELQVANADANHNKFTGKERDAESNLDYFGARYYSSGLGRWMSPDWSDEPEAAPYSDLDDPQSLNLYGYARNSPVKIIDTDGHELIVAAQLQATVTTMRRESPAFNAELAAHEGAGSPDLTIQFGTTPKDPNGQQSIGDTSAVLSTNIQTISTPDEDPNHYNGYKGATVTVSNSISEDQSQIDDVLRHETGHVHDARTNTDQYGRDSQHTKQTNGKSNSSG